MQLSVIILNYNVRYFLELCVLSVQQALIGIDSEIIVIDNNSSDESSTMMQERFPEIKLIQNYENIGFPKGNNMGVAQAQGKYICILNPDTVVAEDTFVKILNFVSSNAVDQNKLGIVGCKLIDGAGNFLPESKRGVPTPWVAFTKVTGLYRMFPHWNFWTRKFGKYYAMDLAQNQTGKVAILVGAFMFMKKELYLEVGGFDENCFMYSDDIDLSYRISKKGKDNYYYHETTVIHYKGESTIKDAKYMQRFQEAMQFFYTKHFSIPTQNFWTGTFLFSIFMRIGIVFFSLFKRFQGVTSRKLSSKMLPKNYLLYSTNRKLLNQLAVVLQNKVVFHDLKTEKMVISFSVTSKRSTEIVLDTDCITFKECILFIESTRNRGRSLEITFKIRPKNANFLIGSNNSNERGEIIKIA